MDNQPEQHRVTFVRMHELVFVRLLAEVEVRRNSVLEEVDDEVAQQNQVRSRSATQLQTLRNHLNQSGRQHESRAQGDEIAQIAPLPTALHNDRPAKNICGSCGQAEEDAGNDWVHMGDSTEN